MKPIMLPAPVLLSPSVASHTSSVGNSIQQVIQKAAAERYPETSNAYTDGMATTIQFIQHLHQKQLLDYAIICPQEMARLLHNYLNQ